MTETQLHCENCDEPIRVERRTAVGLLMTCDCEETYSIKTALALPREWSASA
jgi:RNA polymerase-binding transcription factor DksA